MDEVACANEMQQWIYLQTLVTVIHSSRLRWLYPLK